MIKVCIDAGHGGNDPGAVCGARREKDDVLRLALVVKGELERQQVGVVMTRSSDVAVPILDRCARANREGCAYFLSLHRDAAGAGAKGISAWVHSRANDATFASAQKLVAALLAVTTANDRGTHRGTPLSYTDFGVNVQTQMASALLEVGFVTDSGDNARFDAGLGEYARAIARALCTIVGRPYTDTTTVAPKGETDTGDADAPIDEPKGETDAGDADTTTDAPKGENDAGDASAPPEAPDASGANEWRERALAAKAETEKWQARAVESMGEAERLRGMLAEIKRILG